MKTRNGEILPECLRIGALLETSAHAREVQTQYQSERIAMARGIATKKRIDALIDRIQFPCGIPECERRAREHFYLPIALFHYGHEGGSPVARAFELGIPECPIEREWVDALIRAHVGIWSLQKWHKGVAQMTELVSHEEAEVIAPGLRIKSNLVEPTRLAMVVPYRGKNHLVGRECALMSRAQGEFVADEAYLAAAGADVDIVSTPLVIAAWSRMIDQMQTCPQHGRMA